MIVKKSLLCLSVYVLCSFYHQTLRASEPSNSSSVSSNADNYISSVYNAIDFGKGDKLNPEIFKLAMKGYLNLKSAGKLNTTKEILTVADFTRSSADDRLWIIDLRTHKVVMHTYVAHGQGSGDEYATAFSNTNNSHQSSLGFYVTGDTYNGEHGNSLRLNGMDRGYNDAALSRGIVVHAADYATKDFVAGNQRLGRSWGCPAVDPKLAPSIINTIKGGTCLFIYYPQQRYLASAQWINKRPDFMPNFGEIAALPVAPHTRIATATPKRDTITVYIRPASHL